MTIAIVNGPNMNLLGRREPHLYGTDTLETVLSRLAERFPGVNLVHFQSNHEGALIDYLQQIGFDGSVAGIVLNAAALTHTSLAIADTVAAIAVPTVEVHLTDPSRRTPDLRHTSLLAPVCDATFAGHGAESYALAIEHLISRYGQ